MSFINLAARWLINPKSPDKVVVYSQQGNVTYLALQQQVCQLASAFEAFDIKPNDRIVIAMNDSTQLYTCFLASLACGAIPIVINPKLSDGNQQFIIEDSDASILIHHTVDGISCQFYSAGNETHFCGYQSLLATGVDNWSGFHFKHGDDIAFMQYTSGTTGNPKGVMHSSNNALQSYQAFAQKTLSVTSDDRFYSLAKSFFGYGLGNSVFFPLECGGSVVLDANWPTPKTVMANVSRYKPTVFFGVPAIYQALLSQQGIVAAFSSVRIAVSAGAALPEQLFQHWQAMFGTAILDGLGSTELCHIFCSHTRETAVPGTLGKPLEGYDIDIRDAAGHSVADNVCGKMWVKGPSVAQGYWRNPQATKDKFQLGWYDSGDLALRDVQGNIHFKGRADDLFKVNGRWVIPAEIEARIMIEFSSIVEMALVPTEDEYGLTRAALYVVINNNTANELIAAIKGWCTDELSNFQRPIYIETLTALPRNDNGKVIRRQLQRLSEGVA
ncbi:anthranilate-CoA ligase [Pseudoalteromonas citrea]|uniref:Anthranilate-CoA ligase n=2 Tax=Pseudoalteromonas citrea TaxID=43655 RepID=A0AAD4FQV5_9GAMM|nr:AMP-binding protein [Pseudoalteromonas citrea]KAF7767806.1 anthranilate-CoA ligase [Pseudoalteromonas citrea]